MLHLADAWPVPGVYAAIVTFRVGEEALVSEAKREEPLYRVGFKSANLLKMSLVTTTAMLAICLLALAETTNTAEAENSNTSEVTSLGHC
jgi:hypothetical protein